MNVLPQMAWKLYGTDKLLFRDPALSISSIDDGHLDIDADVSMDLNTPIVNVDEYIKHLGDPDTHIRFLTNRIAFLAGDSTMFDFNSTTLSFFGVTKTTQAAHLADPTNEAENSAALVTLIDELKAYGLMAADP